MLTQDMILIKPAAAATAAIVAASIGAGGFFICSTGRVADDELSPCEPFDRQLRFSHFLAVERQNLPLPYRITS